MPALWRSRQTCWSRARGPGALVGRRTGLSADLAPSPVALSAQDCPIDVFSEDDAGVDAFNERVAAANARFPLEAVSSPPSDWRDRLEE